MSASDETKRRSLYKGSRSWAGLCCVGEGLHRRGKGVWNSYSDVHMFVNVCGSRARLDFRMVLVVDKVP